MTDGGAKKGRRVMTDDGAKKGRRGRPPAPPRVLVYKVNGYRSGQASLLEKEPPANRFDHVLEILSFRARTRTTRSPDREWRLGNKKVDEDAQQLGGFVGWTSTVVESTGTYDEEALEWIDTEERSVRGPHQPFIYDGPSQRLYVVRDRSFRPQTVAAVFQDLLQTGDLAHGYRTEWSVEPLLDQGDFESWLQGTSSVHRLVVVLQRPNPDGLDELAPAKDRLETLNAKQVKEEIVAADDAGLRRGIQEDELTMSSVRMAQRGYGYVRAEGQSGGRNTVYDQREKILSPVLPDDPQEREKTPWQRLTEFVRGQNATQ